jgi:hypothetical protein
VSSCGPPSYGTKGTPRTSLWGHSSALPRTCGRAASAQPLGLAVPGLPATLDGSQDAILSIQVQQAGTYALVLCTGRHVKDWEGLQQHVVWPYILPVLFLQNFQ